jgi:hypothetical protein
MSDNIGNINNIINMSEEVIDVGLTLEEEETTNIIATRGRRSPNYSTKEELIICKAFISASEDCIHGNGMKGYKFEQLMGTAYKILCEFQLREEETAYDLLVRTNRTGTPLANPMVTEVPGHIAPVPFFQRNGKDLLRHFKVNIAPAVSRYCGIRATTPIGTGQNELVYNVAIDAMYRERVGKYFAYGICYEYLRNQEKWKKYLDMEDSASQRRTSRPLGTKAASATKGELVTIEKMVAKETQALASALGKRSADESECKSSFYNSISVAVKETMEIFSMSEIPTPDKLKMKKLKAQIKMEELEVKLKEIKKKNASMGPMDPSMSTPIVLARWSSDDNNDNNNDDNDDDDDEA